MICICRNNATMVDKIVIKQTKLIKLRHPNTTIATAINYVLTTTNVDADMEALYAYNATIYVIANL